MNFVPTETIRRIVPDVDGRNWVYPQKVNGRFTDARTVVGWVLMGVLIVIPLLRVNGMPAILFDIPHRRFILLGQVFWPEDVWLLFFLLFAFAILILLVTAMFGRAWCGYTCPQSVFLTQVYLKIERWIEGDRNQQMKLDRGPWTVGKVGKKALKHFLFIAFSGFIAHVFLAYFVDVRTLVYEILHPSTAYATQMTFVAIITTAFYVDFGFLREQFCNYICPYARFQSALLDQDSLIVAYDSGRGEPRGNVSARQMREQPADATAGDCVDCKKCVVVCPQGIDIRDGLQLECIHCATCIDACDSVMDKLGRPRGLIRYASETELEGGSSSLLRSRTVLYSLLLVGAMVVLSVQLVQRRLVDATLVRPPGNLHMTMASGQLANRFRLQVINKADKPRAVMLRLSEASDLELITSRNPLVLPPGELSSVEVILAAAGEAPVGKVAFTITVEDLIAAETVSLDGQAIFPGGPP